MADAPNQPQAQPVQPEPQSSPLKQIRTFEGDVADAIKRQNESVVSIAQSEQARRDAVRVLGPKEVAEERGRGKLIIYTFLILILIGLGGYGAFYTYNTYKEKTALPVVEAPANQIVSADSIVNIDASTLSRQTLLSALSGERGKLRAATSIEQVVLRRGSAPASELLATADFFTRMASHAPDILVRSLDPLFMYGLLGGAPSHSFLLINVDSFEGAFPGMLAWESRLSEDFLPLFASEALAANVPSSTDFQDITIGNRDARILKDPTGHTVLLYAFFDNKILIITDNEDTFRTLVNRLQAQKLSR